MDSNTPEVVFAGQNFSPLVLLICAIAGIAVIALFVRGVSARVKHQPTEAAAWWLTALSAWCLIFGILMYAVDMFTVQRLVVFGDPPRGMDAIQMEAWQAYTHLAVASAVALAGATARLILGRCTEGDRQPNIRQVSPEAAPSASPSEPSM